MDQGRQIAFFTPNLHTGGAERTMSLLAAGMARRGIRVDFVMVKAAGPFLQQLPTSVRIINLNARSTYTCLPALLGYLNRERPAVMISALDLTNLAAIVARRVTGTPRRLLIRLDSTQSRLERSPGKKKIEKWLLSHFYPSADRVVAVSKSVADDFMRYTGISASKLATIYNPIIPLDLEEKMRQPVDHPWFLSGEPPVILGVGRLVSAKNFPLLVEAFSLVRQTHQARLVILGEGEKRRQIEAKVRELGLQSNVSLPGHTHQPYAYLSRAAAFVLSSAYEGLPSVLVEALACGCPVVSTDCPSGPHEILDGGKYGFLTPVGDAGALARAILEILDGRKKTAPAAWLAQFEQETVLEQYLRLIQAC